MAASTRGRLLVATPVLTDPNFDHTVIAMLDHGADGAIGVVLTRPSPSRVADAVPWLADAADPAEVVHMGGPVSPEVAIAVAHAEPGTPGFEAVVDGIGTLDLPDDAEGSARFPDGVHRWRLFAGYSGWGPGQLESEIAEGAWFVVDLLPDDPFYATPQRLWETVLMRQQSELSWFANFPDDVSAN